MKLGAIRKSCWVYRLDFGTGLPALPLSLDCGPLGIKEVYSPRHADLLLVRGKCSREQGRKLRSLVPGMPSPRVVMLAGAEGAREHLSGIPGQTLVLEVKIGIGDGERAAGIITGALASGEARAAAEALESGGAAGAAREFREDAGEVPGEDPGEPGGSGQSGD